MAEPVAAAWGATAPMEPSLCDEGVYAPSVLLMVAEDAYDGRNGALASTAARACGRWPFDEDTRNGVAVDFTSPLRHRPERPMSVPNKIPAANARQDIASAWLSESYCTAARAGSERFRTSEPLAVSMRTPHTSDPPFWRRSQQMFNNGPPLWRRGCEAPCFFISSPTRALTHASPSVRLAADLQLLLPVHATIPSSEERRTPSTRAPRRARPPAPPRGRAAP